MAEGKRAPPGVAESIGFRTCAMVGSVAEIGDCTNWVQPVRGKGMSRQPNKRK